MTKASNTKVGGKRWRGNRNTSHYKSLQKEGGKNLLLNLIFKVLGSETELWVVSQDIPVDVWH